MICDGISDFLKHRNPAMYLHVSKVDENPDIGRKERTELKRKKVNFMWESEDAQEVFAEWVPFPDAQTSAKDVDMIERFVGLKPPMAILDIGCGNGRHALEFSKRGYRVVGIDVARRFLNEAKEAVKEADFQLEYRLQRASELSEKNAFDFALATPEEFYIFKCRKN